MPHWFLLYSTYVCNSGRTSYSVTLFTHHLSTSSIGVCLHSNLYLPDIPASSGVMKVCNPKVRNLMVRNPKVRNQKAHNLMVRNLRVRNLMVCNLRVRNLVGDGTRYEYHWHEYHVQTLLCWLYMPCLRPYNTWSPQSATPLGHGTHVWRLIPFLSSALPFLVSFLISSIQCLGEEEAIAAFNLAIASSIQHDLHFQQRSFCRAGNICYDSSVQSTLVHVYFDDMLHHTWCTYIILVSL